MAKQQHYLVSYDLVGKSPEDSLLMARTLERDFQAKPVLSSAWVIRSDDDAFILGGRITDASPVFSEELGDRILVVPMKDPTWLLLNPLTNPRSF